MKTPETLRNTSTATGGWLPAHAAKPRTLDLNHWLSRAARGHTWHGHGVSIRRRAH